MIDPIKILGNEFNGKVSAYQKRPGITQILAPFYHADGDMHEVFISQIEGEDSWLLTDFGMTMMKLSYTFDSLSEGKDQLVRLIAKENNLELNDGELQVKSSSKTLYFDYIGMQRAITQIMGVSYQKSIRTQSTFIQDVIGALYESLKSLNPVQSFFPIKNREDLVVDICIPSARPIFIYVAKDNEKYLRAGLTCSELKNLKVPNKSLILLEDMTQVRSDNFRTVTNLVGKQFIGKDTIVSEAPRYVREEVGVV